MTDYCMSEVEIEHQCYCPENSMFCQFMDKRSGICIATSCRRATELLQQVEIERQARAQKEAEEGWYQLTSDLYDKAIEELYKYGATTIDLDISEEDLNDIERSGRAVRIPTEED